MLNNLFFILLAAFLGGSLAKFLKIPTLVGYILAGIIGGLIFSFDSNTSQNIAQIGVILLLFSVGLELSLESLFKVGEVAIIGGILQIISVTFILFLCLVGIGKIPVNDALILSLAFSLSSTAIIVKILSDRGETGTIHYEILTGWSLTQDLAVIPMVALIPTLVMGHGASWINLATGSLLATVLVLGVVLLVGKVVAPYLTRIVAATNNRELLLIFAITLALGTATLVSLFGISAAFGAFLAGVVISKTQENHAIFSETRPLRDIFSVLFFVTLGFLVTPAFIFSHIFVILLLAVFVIVLKSLVTFIICLIFGYRGKTAISVSLGLAQVGEFAFVLFLIAQKLGILTQELASLGMATSLVTLLVSPFLFKLIIPVWHELKRLTAKPVWLNKLFVSGAIGVKDNETLKDHIIICGYGRMGKWIGKALVDIGYPYIVIDYNHRIIKEAKKAGASAIYGDSSSSEILEAAGVSKAKALIMTIPDHIAQQEIIAFCKAKAPSIKIMARVHLDSDMKALNDLKISKVIQPEFEAALSIIKSILVNSGHSKEEIAKKMLSLRLSHSSI